MSLEIPDPNCWMCGGTLCESCAKFLQELAERQQRLAHVDAVLTTAAIPALERFARDVGRHERDWMASSPIAGAAIVQVADALREVVALLEPEG